MIGEILAGVSTIASLFGSLKSAQANNKTDQQLQGRQSELKSWYDKEYNTNYLDTASARGTLAVLRNNNSQTMKKVNQGNVISGASDERAVATADNIQKNDANVIAELGSQGTARQDRIQGQYMNQKSNLDNLQAQNLQQKSQNWSNFGNNAMSTGIGMAEATGAGAFDKADAKAKGFFQGLRSPKPKVQTA